HLIAADIIPILQPIGFAANGRTLRINSDLLAIEVAEALHATKVIYLTNQDGLAIDGQLRRDIAVEALREIVEKTPERIAESARSKALHAVKGIASGIPRV